MPLPNVLAAFQKRKSTVKLGVFPKAITSTRAVYTDMRRPRAAKAMQRGGEGVDPNVLSSTVICCKPINVYIIEFSIHAKILSNKVYIFKKRRHKEVI